MVRVSDRIAFNRIKKYYSNINITKMDVHYLPPNRKTSRPIGDYLIEFLFIFLAVFLGLYMNHYREVSVEKEKAELYAQSLKEDINTDLLNIQRTINEKTWIEAKYDTVEDILATKNLYEYNEYIYYVERYLANTPVFVSRDITFQQLITGNNSRYLKDLNIYKEIAYYYTLQNQYRVLENSYETSYKKDLTGIESKLFNPRDLTSLDNGKAHDYQSLVLRPALKLKTIRGGIENLKFFYIKIDEAKKHANTTKVLLEKQKASGLALMKDLQKEFNLK